MPAHSCRFSEGKNQVFPDNIVKIDLNNFFWKNNDYSKASVGYYPLIVYMKSEYPPDKQGQSYESIYYIQF